MTEDSNVVILDVLTKLDIPADRVIKSALEIGYESIAMVGYDKDGDILFSSNLASAEKILWMLEKFRDRLMKMD